MSESDCGNMIAAKLKEQPFVIDKRIRKMIAGAVAEVDPVQIAALRKMTPAQRFRQAAAMIEWAESVAVHRFHQRQQQLSQEEAIVAVRQRGLLFRERVEEQWRKNQ